MPPACWCNNMQAVALMKVSACSSSQLHCEQMDLKAMLPSLISLTLRTPPKTTVATVPAAMTVA